MFAQIVLTCAANELISLLPMRCFDTNPFRDDYDKFIFKGKKIVRKAYEAGPLETFEFPIPNMLSKVP